MSPLIPSAPPANTVQSSASVIVFRPISATIVSASIGYKYGQCRKDSILRRRGFISIWQYFKSQYIWISRSTRLPLKAQSTFEWQERRYDWLAQYSIIMTGMGRQEMNTSSKWVVYRDPSGISSNCDWLSKKSACFLCSKIEMSSSVVYPLPKSWQYDGDL